MAAAKKVLTVPCLGMKGRTKARHSWNRRMQLLIVSGLVAGIIPTSMRKQSGQAILDIAFYEQAGASADRQKVDC